MLVLPSTTAVAHASGASATSTTAGGQPGFGGLATLVAFGAALAALSRR
ncbi:MAG: hypothetical protein ABEJ04_02060 [Halobacteriaceae archaeon]